MALPTITNEGTWLAHCEGCGWMPAIDGHAPECAHNERAASPAAPDGREACYPAPHWREPGCTDYQHKTLSELFPATEQRVTDLLDLIHEHGSAELIAMADELVRERGLG